MSAPLLTALVEAMIGKRQRRRAACPPGWRGPVAASSQVSGDGLAGPAQIAVWCHAHSPAAPICCRRQRPSAEQRSGGPCRCGRRTCAVSCGRRLPCRCCTYCLEQGWTPGAAGVTHGRQAYDALGMLWLMAVYRVSDDVLRHRLYHHYCRLTGQVLDSQVADADAEADAAEPSDDAEQQGAQRETAADGSLQERRPALAAMRASRRCAPGAA